MNFESFSLTHKKEFDRFFRDQHTVSADSVFTNLALWRFDRNIQVAISDGFLVIKSTQNGLDPMLHFPIGNGKKDLIINRLKSQFEKLTFKAVNSEQKEELINLKIANFTAIHTPQHSDYLYNISDLIDLKGRAYHSKKNFVNRFLANYRSSYENLTAQNQNELIAFVKNWFVNAPYKSDAECRGIVDLIENFELFNVRIGILRADEKIAAFAISEELSNQMVVVHVEKADPSFQGSYQAINKIHLEAEWSGKKIVNREEDLGLEGLKKAKLSYHPVGFVEKYILSLN